MAIGVYKPGDKCPTCSRVVCNCIRCDKCRERVPGKDICTKCYACRKHHVGFYPKDFPHRGCEFVEEAAAVTRIINPLPRRLGVEIELGSFGSITRYVTGNRHITWGLVHDGSVAESGQELVTEPMAGDNYIYGMSALIRDLHAGGARSNSSCGYHVHVDAAELMPLDLRRVLVAFYLVQKSLYGTLVANSRSGEWGQQYCAPLKCDPSELMAMEDKAEFVDWLHQWLYGVAMPSKLGITDDDYKTILRRIDVQLKQYKNTKYVNRARRWALNFHSWMMRGTLEFRLKEGTTDPKDLLLWPLWCGWFVQQFGQTSDKEIHYWLKKGTLSVPECSEFMATGPGGMPDYVLRWVKEKC